MNTGLKATLWFFAFLFYSIYSGLEPGYTIDKQNRHPAGKPDLVVIPQKYRWMFCFVKNPTHYTGKNSVVKAGVTLQLTGYIFAVLQFILWLVILKTNNGGLLKFYLITYVTQMLISIFFVFYPSDIRYHKNMCKAFECNFITCYIESGIGRTYRCKVVSQLDDDTYEINVGILGIYGKRKYRAVTSVPVKVGEKKYAMHTYKPKKPPYWIIRNH